MTFSENLKVELSLLTKNNGVRLNLLTFTEICISSAGIFFKTVLPAYIAIINPKSRQRFFEAWQRFKKTLVLCADIASLP